MTLPRLTTVDGLAVANFESGGYTREGELYCPTCGADRRAWAKCLYRSANIERVASGPAETRTVTAALAPALYELCCYQCRSRFTAVLFIAPTGLPSLAIFSERPGGVATPNTPSAVGYYLDQASRAHSVGATSAAIAMYRAALEQLRLAAHAQANAVRVATSVGCRFDPPICCASKRVHQRVEPDTAT